PLRSRRQRPFPPCLRARRSSSDPSCSPLRTRERPHRRCRNSTARFSSTGLLIHVALSSTGCGASPLPCSRLRRYAVAPSAWLLFAPHSEGCHPHWFARVSESLQPAERR